MFKKILLVCNDSRNRKIYDEVHDWYLKAFQNAYPEAEIHFAYTTRKKHLTTKTSLVHSLGNGENLDTLKEYDFVFISLFTVDKMRDVYKSNCTTSKINKAIVESSNHYDVEKLTQNHTLIKIKHFCDDNNIPSVAYTFDPMIDMHIDNIVNYSFLNIDKTHKVYPILSNIEFEDNEKTLNSEDRRAFAILAYNENLSFLVNTNEQNARKEFTDFFTKINNVNLQYCVTRYVSESTQQTLSNSEHNLLSYENYMSAKRSSKYSFVMPNYNGMTYSWRRFYEDLSIGCLPILIFSEKTSLIIEQIPEDIFNFLLHNNLVINIDNVDHIEKLQKLNTNYDNNALRLYESLKIFVLKEQEEFMNINKQLV